MVLHGCFFALRSPRDKENAVGGEGFGHVGRTGWGRVSLGLSELMVELCSIRIPAGWWRGALGFGSLEGLTGSRIGGNMDA
jgi:hypothetical protein